MPLQSIDIPINFSQGLNTKVDPKQVMPGQFLTLQNVTFNSPEELIKRPGYAALSTSIFGGGSLAANNMVADFKGELIALDNSFLYSYSSALAAWIKKGFTLSLEVEETPIIRASTSFSAPNEAYDPITGLSIFTCRDVLNNTMNYAVVDNNTGVQVVSNTILNSAGNGARPFVFSNNFVVLYGDVNAGGLKYILIPLANPASPGAPVTIDSSGAAFPEFDAVVLGTRLFISYNLSNQTSVKSVYLDTSFVAHGPLTTTGTRAVQGLGVWSDSVLNQIWCSFYNTTSLFYIVYDTNLTSILGSTTIETYTSNTTTSRSTGWASNGAGAIYYDRIDNTQYPFIRTATLTNTGTVGTPVGFINDVQIAAKLFLVNGTYYLTTFYTDSLSIQNTYFVLDQNANIVAKFQPGTSGNSVVVSTYVGFVSNVPIRTATQVSIPILQTDLLESTVGGVFAFYGVTEAILNFSDLPNTYFNTELANNLHISGGTLNIYDGANVVEQNFHTYPTGISATTSTGGFLTEGQYQYIVTYEWTDNQGQVERSTPSIPLTVTLAPGQSKVILTIPTLQLTAKTNIQIVIYRTEVNGTIFYNIIPVGQQILNDKTVKSVTYTDIAPDANIIQSNLLYTTGGVLEDQAPPALKQLVAYRNRLVGIPYENLLSFWYSKQVVPGQPVEFSGFLTQNIDPKGGNLTGIAVMDDKLILFKETQIYFLSGSGPTDTGNQNDFSDPQLITTDAGCIEGKSIVIMPLGLMFKSAKGIYLLDRSLNTTYIGAPVESFNSTIVTSATLMTESNQVRFSLSSGVALVYDYFVKQWSTFTNISANSAVVFEDLYCYGNPNGTVYEETPGVFTDAGVPILMRLQSGWFSFANLQGFQRLYRMLYLGEWKSPHTLTTSIYYDFNLSTPNQVVAVPVLTAPTSPADYEYRLDMNRQKCTSILFDIQESQASSFGEGLSLSGFNFTFGKKMGSNKLTQPQIYS